MSLFDKLTMRDFAEVAKLFHQDKTEYSPEPYQAPGVVFGLSTDQAMQREKNSVDKYTALESARAEAAKVATMNKEADSRTRLTQAEMEQNRLQAEQQQRNFESTSAFNKEQAKTQADQFGSEQQRLTEDRILTDLARIDDRETQHRENELNRNATKEDKALDRTVQLEQYKVTNANSEKALRIEGIKAALDANKELVLQLNPYRTNSSAAQYGFGDVGYDDRGNLINPGINTGKGKGKSLQTFNAASMDYVTSSIPYIMAELSYGNDPKNVGDPNVIQEVYRTAMARAAELGYAPMTVKEYEQLNQTRSNGGLEELQNRVSAFSAAVTNQRKLMSDLEQTYNPSGTSQPSVGEGSAQAQEMSPEQIEENNAKFIAGEGGKFIKSASGKDSQPYFNTMKSISTSRPNIIKSYTNLKTVTERAEFKNKLATSIAQDSTMDPSADKDYIKQIVNTLLTPDAKFDIVDPDAPNFFSESDITDVYNPYAQEVPSLSSNSSLDAVNQTFNDITTISTMDETVNRIKGMNERLRMNSKMMATLKAERPADWTTASAGDVVSGTSGIVGSVAGAVGSAGAFVLDQASKTYGSQSSLYGPGSEVSGVLPSVGWSVDRLSDEQLIQSKDLKDEANVIASNKPTDYLSLTKKYHKKFPPSKSVLDAISKSGYKPVYDKYDNTIIGVRNASTSNGGSK